MREFSKGRVDRKSSIETEPRTLDNTQIDLAREAALYVLHTRSREEANHIFTQGLEAVDTMGVKTASLVKKFDGDDYSDDEEEDGYKSNSQVFKQRPYKGVFTAPF